MKYLALIPLLFLLGCEDSVKNPKPSDVEGLWESLSLYQAYPYGALKFDEQGHGKIVFVDPDNKAMVATFSNFTSKDNSFIVELTPEEDPDEIEFWEGKVSVTNSQLCFTMIEPNDSFMEDLMACFTKSDKIEGLRKIALSKLDGG